MIRWETDFDTGYDSPRLAYFQKTPLNWGEGGAPGRIRTCGLPLRRRTLYPLSYGGAGLNQPRRWACTD
jgi:hypothetical protein